MCCFYYVDETNEVRAMNEIEVNLSQEKIKVVNDAYREELQYWEKVAFDSVLTENERKDLTDLAPPYFSGISVFNSQ